MKTRTILAALISSALLNAHAFANTEQSETYTFPFNTKNLDLSSFQTINSLSFQTPTLQYEIPANLELSTQKKNLINNQYEYKINSDDISASVTTTLNEPTSISRSRNSARIACDFEKNIDSTTSEIEVLNDTSNQYSFIIVPIESTDEGIKTILSIENIDDSNIETVKINDECSYPVGEKKTINKRMIETFKPDETKTIQLGDKEVKIKMTVIKQ